MVFFSYVGFSGFKAFVLRGQFCEGEIREALPNIKLLYFTSRDSHCGSPEIFSRACCQGSRQHNLLKTGMLP